MSDAPAVAAPLPPWIDRALGWLKNYEKAVLLIGCLFQVLVLGGMIFVRAAPLATGDTILLRVVPVDPRDMFRGDYVILNYEFSRVPPQGIEGLPNTSGAQGRTVYVHLVADPDGKHWRMARISTSPAAAPSEKCIRGTVTGWNRVECGIESYYVQEGTGRKYEDAIRSRRLSAEAAVTADGRAALKALHIE